jgi:hypothetical protein
VKDEQIQINYQLDATISPVYYLDVYLQLNMFRPHVLMSIIRSSTTAVAASGFTFGAW